MRTLAELSRFVEEEARAQGRDAVAELEAFRAHYRLARQIAEQRQRLKLSQQKLAELSGVRQSEISKIESGRANPTVTTLAAVLRPLGKSLGLVDTPRPRRRRNGKRGARRVLTG